MMSLRSEESIEANEDDSKRQDLRYQLSKFRKINFEMILNSVPKSKS